MALCESLASAGASDLSPPSFAVRREQARTLYEPRIARARLRHKVQTNEVTLSGVQCLEVLPTSSEARGTLLYFFGGGFVSGWPMQDLPIIAALAEFAGIRVMAPAYRLAPESPWPAALDDALAVYSQLTREVPQGSLAVAGESAGGNLALSLMARVKRLGLRQPAALALVSPWCDMHAGHDYGGAQALSDPTFDPLALQAAANAYAGGGPKDTPEVSPIFASYEQPFPPTLITTGTRDRFWSDCVRLTDAIRSQGGQADLQVWPGMWHVFEFYDEIPEALESLREVAVFLRNHCNARYPTP